MKVYVVVVNYHPANAPQNYKTECQIFWIKRKPKAIRKPRRKNIPYVGGGEYNHCEIFKKHL